MNKISRTARASALQLLSGDEFGSVGPNRFKLAKRKLPLTNAALKYN